MLVEAFRSGAMDRLGTGTPDPVPNPADPLKNPSPVPDHGPMDLPQRNPADSPRPTPEGIPSDEPPPAPAHPFGPQDPIERQVSRLPRN